jgi:hypothetical protein
MALNQLTPPYEQFGGNGARKEGVDAAGRLMVLAAAAIQVDLAVNAIPQAEIPAAFPA